ncbi:MAG: hypothetical protein Q8936_16475, partial [Bacillota bacterium]|nr:hypothetical protein [Bacillota bacterium]
PTVEELLMNVLNNKEMPLAKTKDIGHGTDSKCIALGKFRSVVSRSSELLTGRRGNTAMKDMKTNLILITLGAIILAVEFTVKIDGILGWFLTSAGVILIGIGLFYKSKNPIKMLLEIFLNIF